MRILVTGSSGFTGRYFTDAAKAAGHDVCLLRSNLEDHSSLLSEIDKIRPEAVVHLAAVSFVGHDNASSFYKTNVIGTLHLLDALLPFQASVQTVLLSSSANIYGNCAITPINEEQMPAPLNHYAMSKLAMEYMSKNYLDRLPLFYVRPFNYTGVGQADSFIIPKLVTCFARQNGVLEVGNIDVEREFNDVRFVCEVYLRLLSKSDPGEIYNVCSGRSVSLRSVIQTLKDIAQHDPMIDVNPNFVRNNEIYRLTGDPSKLNRVVGIVDQPLLTDTLMWMYKQAVAQSCASH